jgi:hypothetical protein
MLVTSTMLNLTLGQIDTIYIAQVRRQKTTADETNSSQKLTGRAKPQIKRDTNI